MRLLRYFAQLRTGKIVLWCYLLWYLVTVVLYFDSTASIWLNSLGISVVIGIALMLSVSNTTRDRNQGWQTFRLFAMPFCVSSFSSLIKGRGYWLIAPPSLRHLVLSIAACAAFVAFVLVLRRLYPGLSDAPDA